MSTRRRQHVECRLRRNECMNGFTQPTKKTLGMNESAFNVLHIEEKVSGRQQAGGNVAAGRDLESMNGMH